MEFEECETSGDLVADGERGVYVIIDGFWSFLSIETSDYAGENSTPLGAFKTAKEAMAHAELHDKTVTNPAD